MKVLKKLLSLSRFIDYVVLVILFVALNNCSVNNLDDTNQSLSAEDINVIGQIMGESLSEENSGVVSGINDAIANISRQGFTLDNNLSGQNKLIVTQTEETNFSYTFDEETGIHTVSFIRITDVPSFSMQANDTLKYFYTSSDGQIIANPDINRNRIENVDFTASRNGTLETLRKKSDFARRDTFLISGMSPASGILEINGVHNGSGVFETIMESGVTLKRDYDVEINLLNIAIDKNIATQNQDLTQGVTGTLTWEIVLRDLNGSSNTERSIRGNIELFGDGTALLRFNQLENLFQIDINNGTVKDADEEFEGRIASVSVRQNRFRLVNGTIIQLSDQTEIDDGSDITNLAELNAAIAQNIIIIAEGEGRREGNVFNAEEVEFDIKRRGRGNGDDNDDDDDDDEQDEEEQREIDFKSPVQTVNTVTRILRLRNTISVLITDSTEIDGELISLEEVRQIILDGNTVIADGEGIALDGGPADVEATEIEFELEEDDD